MLPIFFYHTYNYVFVYGYFSRHTLSWARLGVLNIYSTVNDFKPVEYEIVERVIHPDYNSSYVYNDIALLRLESDVEFSAHVRPICLNTDRSLQFRTATAIGWGRTDQSKYQMTIVNPNSLGI